MKARSLSVSPSMEGSKGPPTVRFCSSLRGSPKGFSLQGCIWFKAAQPGILSHVKCSQVRRNSPATLEEDAVTSRRLL